MDLIIPIYKFNFLKKKELFLFFLTSKKILKQLDNIKSINNILMDFIKNNNINEFKFFINNINESILTTNFTYKNIYNININTSIITEILNLNRIDLLNIIYNKFGFIGKNYSNIIFNNFHYLTFNISKKLELLLYLNKKNYSFKLNNTLNNKCNFNKTNFWNYNNINNIDLLPLHIISYFNNIKIIKLYYDYIIKYNIQKIDDTNNYNISCFLFSINLQNLEYSKFLIENNCNIFISDTNNCNFFHYLCNTENTYDNNKFFYNIFNFIKFKQNIKKLLYQKNNNKIKPIDYILKYGKYSIFKKLYNLNLISCNYEYIEIVQSGYKYYFNNIYKSKNFEKTYQFNEYLKLIKLLIVNNFNFKYNNVTKKDPLYNVYKYIS